jgi:hypothetical protein
VPGSGSRLCGVHIVRKTCLQYPVHASQNYVVTLTYVHGMDIVVDTYNSTMNATLNSQPISSVDQYNIRQYLDKLDLVPG